MRAKMSSASFNSEIGKVQIQLETSTVNGYPNQVFQYTPFGIMSVPTTDLEANLDVQESSQVQATGYCNRIIDEEYSIQSGETTIYSKGDTDYEWYLSTRQSGIEAQEAQTPNKENFMMGQSTNEVLGHILQLLINIVDTLGTMQEDFDLHTHISATPGDPTGVPGVSVPPILFPTPPSDTDVVTDQTYINDNKNLAITGTYTPR